jgi:hypothetical protein
MKLFICWSGEPSHKIALALRDWIPAVVPSITPWVSSEDIRKGTRWGAELAKQLEDAFYGAICLTPDNIREPWLLFEAGALSKAVGESRVFPLLFGVDPGQLPGPLAQFQVTTYEKEDVRKFMHSLNEAPGYQSTPPEQLNRVFEYSWHGLQGKLDPLLKKVLKLSAEASKDVSESTGTATLLESVLESVEGTVSAKRTQDTDFHPMEIQILRDLYAVGDERVTADEVARFLKCENSKAMYFLDKLQDRGLIEGREYYVNGPEEYSLTKQGRAFLIEKDLV